MTLRCVRLPIVHTVPSEAVERLQHWFMQAKSTVERERFWLKVQRSKQPSASPRNPIPRYLRVVVDEEFVGPIG